MTVMIQSLKMEWELGHSKDGPVDSSVVMLQYLSVGTGPW